MKNTERELGAIQELDGEPISTNKTGPPFKGVTQTKYRLGAGYLYPRFGRS